MVVLGKKIPKLLYVMLTLRMICMVKIMNRRRFEIYILMFVSPIT
jgi:hypothetical protein